MKKYACLFSFLILLLSISCKNTNENPAAEGFNWEGSDSSAIAIADKVMAAQGGRKAWDNARYFYWNFFGGRDLLWDKETGNTRIYSFEDSTLYLFNIHDMAGRVFVRGEEVTDAEEVGEKLKNAKGMWINDGYWLFMPFKLKDSGVTLKYLRQDETLQGEPAHVLQLTFEEVGNTPDNKYEIYVDTSDYLVKQWAFFRSSQQDSATAVWPWDNYKNFDGLMLSSDRSDNRGPRNAKVLKTVPEGIFTDPAVDMGFLRE